MDIKLRKAKQSDIPILKKLWQICFGDRMRYIDAFFEYMFKKEHTLVAEADGTVAGVTYILERNLNNKKFLYGYAIGVFPEFRGRDICHMMLDHIKENIKGKDVYFGLHPANDKLSEFYQKIGLKPMYSLKVADVDESSYIESELKDISTDEFYNMRSDAFENSVTWDKKALEYILKNGENVKKININGRERYFILRKEENLLIIKETTATDDEIRKVNGYLKREFDVENTRYYLSSKSALHGIKKCMVYGFSEFNDDIYMNLFLD